MVGFDLRSRLRLEHAVFQAPLGGGLSGPELAAAVSGEGGLGAVGIVADPERFRVMLRRTRLLTGDAPFSANLPLPVSRPAHVHAVLAERVPIVSLSFGFAPSVVRALQQEGCFVLHQVGTEAEAETAIAHGADALIVQGLEAGGHLLGTERLASVLPRVRAVARGRPIIAAGGIHDAESARRAVDLGADGVAAGTRFLLTPESRAHAAYKQRLLAAGHTLVTLLFGLGWQGRHRVVPNRATDRWCTGDLDGPRMVRVLERFAGPLGRVLPAQEAERLVRLQRPDRPFFTPLPLRDDMDGSLVDATPLYGGECVAQIETLEPAAAVVAELASGLPA